MLQENEEKVVVEESIQLKSYPENGGQHDGEPPETSSSDLEKWIVKIEQSINILLTVYITYFSLPLVSAIENRMILLAYTC